MNEVKNFINTSLQIGKKKKNNHARRIRCKFLKSNGILCPYYSRNAVKNINLRMSVELF